MQLDAVQAERLNFIELFFDVLNIPVPCAKADELRVFFAFGRDETIDGANLLHFCRNGADEKSIESYGGALFV